MVHEHCAGVVIQTSVRDNWQHELAKSYTVPAELGKDLGLPDSWIKAHESARRLFAMRVPRHYASLMTPGDTNDPLLLQVMPALDEFDDAEGYSEDPLAEQAADALPGLLHKYKSRVLVLLKGGCAVNCRYCFRRHFPYPDHTISKLQLQQIMNYLEGSPDINEVILSGGDPLMAQDQHLLTLIDELESIPHITRIRIHSRLPVVIPDRLTKQLADKLAASRLHAILVLHVNHPREVSSLLKDKLTYWRQQGIHILNQSVLLRNINDSGQILTELSEALFDAGVLPYYLHQLDKVKGAAHFETSNAVARELMVYMLRELPGFLVPKFVREIGGKSSKTPIDLRLD